MATEPGPTFRFSNGALHISAPPLFLVIRGRPRLEAQRRSRRGADWEPYAPAFRLVHPYRRPAATRKARGPQLELPLGEIATRPSRRELRRRAFDGFRFSLRKEDACAVERFPCMQWRLLWLFRLEPRAVEVCRINPALTFFLANAYPILNISHMRDIRLVAEFIVQRQRDVMFAVRLPETDAAAKVLAKIPPESVAPELLPELQRLFADSASAKFCAHAPVVNKGVVALLADARVRGLATANLVAEVGAARQEKYRASAAQKIADTLDMLERMERPAPRAPFRSVEQIQRLHDAVASDFLRHRVMARAEIRFPAPPFPGTANIRHVRTAGELLAEGRAQSNCVGSYVPRVAAGEVHIFQVTHPQRATLSLVRGPGGGWEIGELLLGCNRQVSPETRYRVQDWIDQHMIFA